MTGVHGCWTCSDNNLTLTNIMFQHHQRRRCTWKSPGIGVRNQIDYILIRSRFTRSLLNDRAYQENDCASNRNAVGVAIRLVTQTDSIKKPVHHRIKPRRLEDSETRESYSEEVKNRFELLNGLVGKRPVDEQWSQFKTIYVTAQMRYWEKKKKSKKNKSWISDETLRLWTNVKLRRLVDPSWENKISCTEKQRVQYRDGSGRAVRDHRKRHEHQEGLLTL